MRLRASGSVDRLYYSTIVPVTTARAPHRVGIRNGPRFGAAFENVRGFALLPSRLGGGLSRSTLARRGDSARERDRSSRQRGGARRGASWRFQQQWRERPFRLEWAELFNETTSANFRLLGLMLRGLYREKSNANING